MARIDRRVARTRALLQQAHLRLIAEKGYEAVTVEDICAAANVGRSTFYAHYPNKEELHRSGVAALREELSGRRETAEHGHDGGGVLGFSRAMFEHAQGQLPLYRALAGSRGGSAAIEEIRRMLLELARQGLAAEAGPESDPLEREFAARYLTGAYLAVLTWWLDGGAVHPVAQMDALFQRMAAQGLAGFAASG